MAFTTIGTVARKIRSFLANHSEAGASAFLVELPDNSLSIAQADANGYQKVSVESAAMPTGVATEAKQDSILVAIASLATAALQGALNSLVITPETMKAITPSDATDTSTLTEKGLIVSVAGILALRSVGDDTNTVTLNVVAGQYVPIQCARVMAATTATVVGVA